QPLNRVSLYVPERACFGLQKRDDIEASRPITPRTDLVGGVDEDDGNPPFRRECFQPSERIPKDPGPPIIPGVEHLGEWIDDDQLEPGQRLGELDDVVDLKTEFLILLALTRPGVEVMDLTEIGPAADESRLDGFREFILGRDEEDVARGSPVCGIIGP